MQFLDTSLLDEFRKTINSTSIFRKSDRLKEKFNLICVVMDRLESAINYLNKHSDPPRTEEDFVCFLVYACMVRDAILKLYENIYQRKPDFLGRKQFFKYVKQYSQNAFSEDTCPTDEVFFEYLRAMAFAHPFETGNRRERLFLETNEKHYCPWVIVQGIIVGIRVCTSSDKFIIKDLTFPFDDLKGYIKSIYAQLHDINKWAKEEIVFQDEEWKKRKVDRTGSVTDILHDIKEIYAERFLEPYDIECIETYLNCTSTNAKNSDIVKSYQLLLNECIYKICDALDSNNYDMLDSATEIITMRPNKAHPMMHYQLEKIYCYLDNDHGWMDSQWGLIQAQVFSKEFASKWVIIDIDSMNFDEIKLLVTIACYYEAINQE